MYSATGDSKQQITTPCAANANVDVIPPICVPWGKPNSSEINCLVCEQPESTGDPMVQCGCFDRWFHFPCIEIDSDTDLGERVLTDIS